MIGIGVTTHGRPDQLRATRDAIAEFLPPGAKVVVVDDASPQPATGADFRFERNVGIAVAKNKCLELLDKCQHIFLFDDDCRPRKAGWELPYVGSREPHLMYVFQDFAQGPKLNDTVRVYGDDEIVAWSHPRGCMLYFDRSCLDRAGGMDVAFGKWGWEHADLSDRIFQCGLTTFPYQDVVGSAELIYSADEYRAAASTCKGAERQACIARNKPIYDGARPSYVPYRSVGGEEAVLTCYFNAHPDPQRGHHWEANVALLEPLMASVAPYKLYVMHDCLDGAVVPAHVELVHCASTLPAIHQRWVSYYQFLNARPDIARVWCVDGSDVEMLRDPFLEMRDLLYVGDEPTVVGCPWMVRHHPQPTLRAFIAANAQKPLVNSGLLGGEAYRVKAFIRGVLEEWQRSCKESTPQMPSGSIMDMGGFNLVAYTRFASVLSHGRQVNTVFKANARDGDSWWKHK